MSYIYRQYPENKQLSCILNNYFNLKMNFLDSKHGYTLGQIMSSNTNEILKYCTLFTIYCPIMLAMKWVDDKCLWFLPLLYMSCIQFHERIDDYDQLIEFKTVKETGLQNGM